MNVSGRIRDGYAQFPENLMGQNGGTRMAKRYIGENAVTYLVTLLKAALSGKADSSDERLSNARTPVSHAASHGLGGTDPVSPGSIGAIAAADIVDGLSSAAADKVLSARQGKILAERIANAGGGDMLRSVYDADGDGVADNAAALDGHPASYFAKAGDAADYIASQKGQANGLVPLGEDQKISSLYLPSYVDDVVEGYYAGGAFYADSKHAQPLPGESGKIYVDLHTNVSYRYSGSTYIAITSSDMAEISNTELQGIWDAIQ